MRTACYMRRDMRRYALICVVTKSNDRAVVYSTRFMHEAIYIYIYIYTNISAGPLGATRLVEAEVIRFEV